MLCKILTSYPEYFAQLPVSPSVSSIAHLSDSPLLLGLLMSKVAEKAKCFQVT